MAVSHEEKRISILLEKVAHNCCRTRSTNTITSPLLVNNQATNNSNGKKEKIEQIAKMLLQRRQSASVVEKLSMTVGIIHNGSKNPTNASSILPKERQKNELSNQGQTFINTQSPGTLWNQNNAFRTTILNERSTTPATIIENQRKPDNNLNAGIQSEDKNEVTNVTQDQAIGNRNYLPHKVATNENLEALSMQIPNAQIRQLFINQRHLQHLSFPPGLDNVLDASIKSQPYSTKNNNINALPNFDPRVGLKRKMDQKNSAPDSPSQQNAPFIPQRHRTHSDINQNMASRPVSLRKNHTKKQNVERGTLSKPKVREGTLVKNLLNPSDLYLVTDLTYAVMSEYETCTFTSGDTRGNRGKVAVGYPGLQCRYCKGSGIWRSGRYFPTTIKTMADSKKTLLPMFDHLMNCTECPNELKKHLAFLRQKHASIMLNQERVSRAVRLPHGGQRHFFRKLWKMTHD